MWLRKYAGLLGAVLLFLSVNAQETLKGIVLETDEKGNISPVPGASVHWLFTSVGTTTDSSGVFQIPFNSQTRKLIVSYVGLKPDTLVIAKQNFVKVVLITKNRLNEVDIVYQRKSTEISYLDPWKTTIMNEKELFKQACCNLAESFETNPSVDVAFTDAITGTRQIQMLGLASQYTQVTQEYMPSIRGLATNYGFSYTPGTWLNSIQVTKGVGSVVNGFESISGVINTELHKSDVKDRFFVNAYAGSGGRYELNINFAQKASPKFSHSFLLHGSTVMNKTDHNHDGYMDNPVGNQRNALYRFKWDINRIWMVQGGVRFLTDTKSGGMIDYTKGMPTGYLPYGINLQAGRMDGWLKIGYVFPKKVYKSFGLQLAGVDQIYSNAYGRNNYDGIQHSYYVNLIYQSLIGTSDHKFRTGLSIQSDDLDETLVQPGGRLTFSRKEIVTGSFFEYSFSQSDRFTAVAGVRVDYNNLFGVFYSPRLHVRYVPFKKTVLRFSAGTGQRTANVIAENSGFMASNRSWMFMGNASSKAYGFLPERAINYGLNLTHEFKLNYRPGTFTIDYYYTDFIRQVVVDRDAATSQVQFYSLNGKSYSGSFQVQLDYEPVRRLDVRIAYRYYDVRTQYHSGMKEVPMIARQRGFLNVAYQTKSKWSVDATWQLNGAKRLPSTTSNHADMQLPDYSSPYSNVNLQLTKSFQKIRLDLYSGVENVFNFMQMHPIIDGSNPFGAHFDASMVWGPVFGRMFYGGLRYRL